MSRSNKEKIGSSRGDAIDNGYSYYFTGSKCKHGHVSKRQAKSGNCYECILTTHKASRKNYVMTDRRKSINAASHNKRNDESRKRADNAGQSWPDSDILIAVERVSNGQYKHTCYEASKILKRSYRSIEHVRVKYKDTDDKFN